MDDKSKSSIGLTVKDIAKRLQIGRNSAYELMNQRDFPSFRIGKCLRVTEAALEEYLNNRAK
jgi:excisionase family DNA binding protein